MANIDKKLAKKLAKMPEEERQAFLENLRLQEEENQRKKEEMLLRFLKVIVSRHYTYYTGSRLSRTSWRRKRRLQKSTS